MKELFELKITCEIIGKDEEEIEEQKTAFVEKIKAIGNLTIKIVQRPVDTRPRLGGVGKHGF